MFNFNFKEIIIANSQKIKLIGLKLIPEFIIHKIRSRFKKIIFIFLLKKLIKTRKVFLNAQDNPKWLDWKELIYLHNKYPLLLRVKYDSKSLKKRGLIKAKEIINLIPSNENHIKNFLELGCHDGMVCYYLQLLGKIAIGIDINSSHFDDRALNADIHLLEMNAENLEFKDESFDFIFSYNSFEHFNNPENVLLESLRTVRKGGYIYLTFSPLYMSPWGMHKYKSINIPYSAFLFPLKLLKKLSKIIDGLIPLGELELNKWSLKEYRELWEKYSSRLLKIKYKEYYNLFHLDLIKQYPSCFKTKTDSFDNLIVSRIDVLFKKIS